jgi:hypothetical protein
MSDCWHAGSTGLPFEVPILLKWVEHQVFNVIYAANEPFQWEHGTYWTFDDPTNCIFFHNQLPFIYLFSPSLVIKYQMSPASTSNMKHSKLTVTTSPVRHAKSPLSVSHLPPASDNHAQPNHHSTEGSVKRNVAETSTDRSAQNRYTILKREIKELAEVRIVHGHCSRKHDIDQLSCSEIPIWIEVLSKQTKE